MSDSITPRIHQPLFPYFGGKATVAAEVWKRFGNPRSYVEPFFGSGAVLLSSQADPKRTETVNDKDGYIVNFFRTVKHSPKQLLSLLKDYPVAEVDMHSRNKALIDNRPLLEPQLSDPTFHDPTLAAYFVYCMSAFISPGAVGSRNDKSRPNLSGKSRGLFSDRSQNNLNQIISSLSRRLSRVRILYGDFQRTIGKKPPHHTEAIFLDPPYPTHEKLYNQSDTSSHQRCYELCIKYRLRPDLRIAFCTYIDNYDDLSKHYYTPFYWKAQGGLSNTNRKGNDNKYKEVIFFSRSCFQP